MPAAAVIPAPTAYVMVVAVNKLAVGFLPRTVGPPFWVSRLCLHFIVWSDTRKLFFEEIRMFQARACEEHIGME